MLIFCLAAVQSALNDALQQHLSEADKAAEEAAAAAAAAAQASASFGVTAVSLPPAPTRRARSSMLTSLGSVEEEPWRDLAADATVQQAAAESSGEAASATKPGGQLPDMMSSSLNVCFPNCNS